MSSRTNVLPNRTKGPARRRATRLAHAAVILSLIFASAVSCADGGRLSGPFQPLGPQVRHLKTRYNSVAPAERKTPWLFGTSASASRNPSATGALFSASGSAPDPGVPVTQIPFAPEAGPFENLLPEDDDGAFGPFDIGFDFTFFGNTYSQFWISTNGFISFDPVYAFQGCCSGQIIPTIDNPAPQLDDPNNLVAFAWSDLNMVYGQVGFETRGTAPNRRLVINLQDVLVWEEDGGRVTVQLILREGSNAVEIHTTKQPMTSDRHPFTQGVENADGTKAAFVPGRVRASFELDNDGVRFGGPAGDGNRAPTVSVAERFEGVEGSEIKFSAVGSDADKDNLSYSWDFDGDGQGDAEGAEVAYAYDDDGEFAARVTVSDGRGLSASANAQVVVKNVAPTAVLNAAEVVDEGSPVALSVSDIVDPSAADKAAGFKFAFDCGAGAGFGEFGTEASAACPTVDNGVRTVALKIRDKNGDESAYSKSVTIRNLAPVVEVPARLSAKSGQLISLSGRFSDAGVNDQVWRWNWGTPSQGVALASQLRMGGQTSQQGAVAAEYRACGGGAQAITLEVVDKDGDRGTATVIVDVERQGVEMKVKPSWIALRAGDRDEDSDEDSDHSDRYGDGHGRLVTVYLFSSESFDATAIDPSAVRLTNGSGKGTPVASKKVRNKGQVWEIKTAHLNRDRLRDVKLRFSRNALIANGDLTRGTTSLMLVGRVGTCANVTATGPVYVKP